MFAFVLRCFACVVFAVRLAFAGINEGILTTLGSWSTEDVLGLQASSSCDVAHDLGTGGDSAIQACASAVVSNGALQDIGSTETADALIVDLSSQPGDEVLVNADDGIESIKAPFDLTPLVPGFLSLSQQVLPVEVEHGLVSSNSVIDDQDDDFYK